MSAFLITVGVVLVGTAAWLLARVVVMPRLRFEAHLRDVESYGFEHDDADESPRIQRGLLIPALNRFAASLGRLLMRALPQLRPLTRSELTAAGHYGASPDEVHGYRAIAALLLVVIALLAASSSSGFSLLRVAFVVLALLLGWQLPSIIIHRQGRLRLDAIDRDLPQFIDLLVATVEAGVGFGGALNNVSGRFTGPLGQELQLTMQQQNLGIGTEAALTEMLDRVDTPSVRAFVRAVVRAESHGVSIGPIMRHLAHDIRQRRRDLARERIQKAPVKMLIPLVIFILLPLLLVIMYPALYNIIHVLRGS